jgi:hypothetical protein
MPGRRLVTLVVAVLLGCSLSDDEGSGDPAQLWCEGYCTMEQRCTPSTSQTSCRQNCVASRPGLATFSANGAKLVGDCVAGFACNVRQSEVLWDAEFQTCWSDARTKLEPRAHVRNFCGAFIEHWFDCGLWFPQSECESIYGMWSDAVIDRLAQCQNQLDCEAFDSCVAGVFETP